MLFQNVLSSWISFCASAVLYHLGSLHAEMLRSCWAPQKPFCSHVGTSGSLADRYTLPTDFTSLANLISFMLLTDMDALYPSCPNMHVASFCSCHGMTVRSDDSTDAKWT